MRAASTEIKANTELHRTRVQLPTSPPDGFLNWFFPSAANKRTAPCGEISPSWSEARRRLRGKEETNTC